MTAGAQGYPNRPVRMIVPYAPGGIVDYVGRLVSPRLAEQVQQNIVVDNRPGGGGVIAVETTARAIPDGHTVLLSDPAIVINPSLLPKVSFDIDKDLSAVTLFAQSALVMTVNAKVPAATVQELLNIAKAPGGRVSYGSAGVGTTPHMAGELLKVRSGQDMTHVPYKGMGPAVTDLVGGQVQVVFGSIPAVLPFIKEGRLRGLATTGAKRAAALTNLPTIAEAGFPGYEVSIWLSVFAPAAVPREVTTRLNGELRKVLQAPDVRGGLEKVGIEPVGSSPEDATTFVRTEYRKWADVIRTAKIKSE
jgi:tripartite-type tricarboxylate transporter receptor subunit TctC